MVLYQCPHCNRPGIDGSKDRTVFTCSICSRDVPAEEVAHFINEMKRQ